jgi:hypothetical protein
MPSKSVIIITQIPGPQNSQIQNQKMIMFTTKPHFPSSQSKVYCSPSLSIQSLPNVNISIIEGSGRTKI